MKCKHRFYKIIANTILIIVKFKNAGFVKSEEFTEILLSLRGAIINTLVTHNIILSIKVRL